MYDFSKTRVSSSTFLEYVVLSKQSKASTYKENMRVSAHTSLHGYSRNRSFFQLFHVFCHVKLKFMCTWPEGLSPSKCCRHTHTNKKEMPICWSGTPSCTSLHVWLKLGFMCAWKQLVPEFLSIHYCFHGLFDLLISVAMWHTFLHSCWHDQITWLVCDQRHESHN